MWPANHQAIDESRIAPFAAGQVGDHHAIQAVGRGDERVDRIVAGQREQVADGIAAIVVDRRQFGDRLLSLFVPLEFLHHQPRVGRQAQSLCKDFDPELLAFLGLELEAVAIAARIELTCDLAGHAHRLGVRWIVVRFLLGDHRRASAKLIETGFDRPPGDSS